MEESDSGQQPKRCACGFWGSAQTSGLCSKCYKATVTDNTPDGLDAKSELLRNRQSAYTSHDGVGATSSTFLASNRSQPSSSTMEKAGELLRQAVKKSSADKIDKPQSVTKENCATSTVTYATENSVNTDNISTVPCATKNSVNADNTSAVTCATQNSVNADNTSAVTCATQNSVNADSKVDTADCDHSKDNITDLRVVIAPSTSDNSAAAIEKCVTVVEVSKHCEATESNNVVEALASPDKRGVKRDRSAVDDSTPNSSPEKRETKSKKRCAVCKCKLELAQRTIGKCKCDNVYCSLHRLPELHNCIFDHKEDGRREAREKMVKPTRHLGTSFKRLDSDS